MLRGLVAEGRVSVRVSARSCRLRFIPCGPECIARGCTAKCCDAPTSPTGIRVHVMPAEARRLAAMGIKSRRGFILPRPGERLCPAKTAGHLCGLWQRPERPFGCIVSPFALNKSGTLIIRNRYKLLPCYDRENGHPAYLTFRSSLVAIFGTADTVWLTTHLDRGGGDIVMQMDERIHKHLVGRENALQQNAS